MSLLNKAAILTSSDKTTEAVDVPQWGGSVVVGSLTGQQAEVVRHQLRQVESGKVKPGTWLAQVVCFGVLDENGMRMFADTDVAAIAAKRLDVLELLAEKILALSGMTDSAKEAIEKN